MGQFVVLRIQFLDQDRTQTRLLQRQSHTAETGCLIGQVLVLLVAGQGNGYLDILPILQIGEDTQIGGIVITCRLEDRPSKNEK